MKYKLIAVDIDGTLLNSQGILTKRTRDTIHRLWKDGIHFAISTGRPIQGVMPLVEEIGLDLPLITYNGSMVLTATTREVIYQRVMEPHAVRDVYALGESLGVTMLLWSNNRLYTNRVNEKSKYYSKITNTELERIDSLETLEKETTKILWHDEVERINELLASIPGRFNNESVVYHTSRPYFLEFVDKEASKAIAIEVLSKSYSITRDQVMAIGDSYNDISMLEYAGLGVAMGNAPEDIKKVADVITATCDEDGVAEAIEKYVYGGSLDEGNTDQ